MTGAEEIRERARHVLVNVVQPAVFGPGHVLSIGAHHVGGEPISYDEALRRPYQPFSVGDVWGPAWDTTWFRLSGHIPPRWAGGEVVLRFENAHRGDDHRQDGANGGEALVWRGGVPICGMSALHPAAVLTHSAAGGEPVELRVEAAANPALPQPMSGLDWPVLRPEHGGEPRFRLRRCELALRHREVYALACDVRTVLGLAIHLDDEEVAGELYDALAAACGAVNPGDVAGSAPAARAALAGVLAAPGVRGVPEPTAAAVAHRITAVGHAHIDTAWLWPLRETVRKCARTFATAVTLMEGYPDYHFVASAAQHLAWMEEHYPALFARIGERVRSGQFQPVGSMWVEADCNLPSGESLVRQIVTGKRWFASRFGVECTELWLPDAFGYTAALPQIMAEAGIGWFVSQKLSWNDTNRFPFHTFFWQGIDGTRVRAHFPPADTYNGDMTMSDLFRGARNVAGKAGGSRSLYPFGYGDGGGGPTQEMLEAARRAADLAGAPRVALEPAHSFFAAAEADPAPLPTWVGDLYLEKHRATYTSQAAIKAGNRRDEAALQAAELWSTVRSELLGAPWPAEALESAWKVLLTNQFHDILPGSSIRWVAEQAAAELAEVQEAADALTGDALDALAAAVDTTGMAEPVVVFNPTPFPRQEVVDGGGRLFVAEVPALGYATVDLAAPPSSGGPGGVEAGPGFLRNEHLELRFDGHGRLVSVWDRDHHREALEGPGNVFHLHEDRPADWDAWDVDRAYLDAFVELAGPVDVEVVEAGGLRGALRFRRRFGASALDQAVVLTAGSRRIDFVTDVDWGEDHKFLKVAFPVAVHARHATFEIQFGHLARPTHENTAFEQARFEVCAQRFADLSETGYGVALLNDCKYGYDVRGNVLRLSLLRAPTAPDPLCDRGRHRFTYAFLPHAGHLGEVIPAGYSLNAPLVVRPAPAGRAGPLAPSRSFVTVDDPGFVVETVKRADDGTGVVVRGYEALGWRRRVQVRPAFAFRRALRTDLLERERDEVPISGGGITLGLRPFELVTLKLVD